MKAMSGVNIRAHIELRAVRQKSVSSLKNHLSEYMIEGSRGIENESGCRYAYALLSELQNQTLGPDTPDA